MDKKTLEYVIRALQFYKSVNSWTHDHEKGATKTVHDGGSMARTALIALGVDQGLNIDSQGNDLLAPPIKRGPEEAKGD